MSASEPEKDQRLKTARIKKLVFGEKSSEKSAESSSSKIASAIQLIITVLLLVAFLIHLGKNAIEIFGERRKSTVTKLITLNKAYYPPLKFCPMVGYGLNMEILSKDNQTIEYALYHLFMSGIGGIFDHIMAQKIDQEILNMTQAQYDYNQELAKLNGDAALVYGNFLKRYRLRCNRLIIGCLLPGKTLISGTQCCKDYFNKVDSYNDQSATCYQLKPNSVPFILPGSDSMAEFNILMADTVPLENYMKKKKTEPTLISDFNSSMLIPETANLVLNRASILQLTNGDLSTVLFELKNLIALEDGHCAPPSEYDQECLSKEVWHRQVLRDLNCILPSLQYLRNGTTVPGVKFCNWDQIVKHHTRPLWAKEQPLNTCKPPCQATKYSFVPYIKGDVFYSRVKKYMKLQLTPRQEYIEVLEEVYQFQSWDYLSLIGGIMGLWLGFSVHGLLAQSVGVVAILFSRSRVQ